MRVLVFFLSWLKIFKLEMYLNNVYNLTVNIVLLHYKNQLVNPI